MYDLTILTITNDAKFLEVFRSNLHDQVASSSRYDRGEHDRRSVFTVEDGSAPAGCCALGP